MGRVHVIRRAQRRSDRPSAGEPPRDILGLRAQLLQRGLSLKYVKNILGGSFKAMIRDAREIDRVVTLGPFVGLYLMWVKVNLGIGEARRASRHCQTRNVW